MSLKTVTRYRTIQYKRVVLTNSAENLQNLLASALIHEHALKAQQRREAINPDSQIYRLINRHSSQNGVLFGQLVRFESGKAQSVITLDSDAEYYEIKPITTDKIESEEERAEEEKKRKEFIESVLYFGCLNNHLILVQSAALRARDLETHIGWLLGSQTKLIETNTAILLQDKPPESIIKKVIAGSVKRVNIGSLLTTSEQTSSMPEGNNPAENVKSVKWLPTGRGARILSAILGENWRKEFALEDSLDESNINVKVQVTYDRKTDKSGQKTLDKIATSLRHIDEDDCEIELKEGGKINGSDLKLNGKIGVKMINGSIDENDLYHQMHSWLVTKVGTGDIETTDTD